MDRENMNHLKEKLRCQYQDLKSKKERNQFINERLDLFSKIGIPVPHRKAFIRDMNQKAHIFGRKPLYVASDIAVLEALWQMNGFACGKRLKPALEEWIKFYDCTEDVRKKLTKISAATIDRLLAQSRIKYQRENTHSTVPQKAHIRQRIKLREPGQIADRPGFTETDTARGSLWGSYLGKFW